MRVRFGVPQRTLPAPPEEPRSLAIIVSGLDNEYYPPGREVMVKAVGKNGVIVPRSPLPEDWQEGTKVEARAMGVGSVAYGRRKDVAEFTVDTGLNRIEPEERQFVLSAIVDITERKLAEE